MSMKKIVTALLLCIFVFTAVGCGGNSDNREGQVETPSGSSIQKGENYQTVIDAFAKNGFTNIKTEPIEDLITGWLTKDGEVEEVSVGGDVNYGPNQWVAADTEVLIKYHTYPQKTSGNSTNTVTTTPAVTTPEKTTLAPLPTTKPVTTTPPETTAVTKVTSTSTPEEPIPTVLTVENSKELAKLLNTKDAEFSPLTKEFAEKYDGKTIEFDGNTAAVQPHGNYTTRFDYLIYAGDYSETSVKGPSFQFRDVNYYDLHLTGKNIPDVFDVGLNIHIVATVGDYNETSGLFQLIPVSITMRK